MFNLMHPTFLKHITVDFTKLWPQMFRTLLQSSEVHIIGIDKPLCKQSPWLVREDGEVKEANQMRSLQTGLWISLKNSLTIHEENTKKNHKRVVSVYVIQIHVDLHKL